MVETPCRVAIVTGATGGIGSVLSRRLAEEGYVVVAADMDAARTAELAASLPPVAGCEHVGFAGDLTDSAVNDELVERAAAVGPIVLVVNGVGISPKGENGRRLGLKEITDELWQKVMNVNVAAPFYLIRAVHDRMPTDGSASIVNILSVVAKLGVGADLSEDLPPYLPSTLAYGASKAALQNMTASLCRELASRNIRVNGVAPGFVATPMMSVVSDAGPLMRQLPIKRFAEPGEIADAVVFLASEKARYINGISLDVNGGWVTC